MTMLACLRRVAIPAVLVLGSLTAAVTAGAQEGGQGVAAVESPRQVTGNADPLRLFDIPALAAHPDDPSTVVMAVGDARNGGCGLRVSRDGGLSWLTTIPDFQPEQEWFCLQRPLFPVMDPTFGPDGTLHIAMPFSTPETGHPDGLISMLAARTDDLGETFELTTVAAAERVTADPGEFGQEGDPTEGLEWHKSPSLAVDPTNPDKVYLAMRWNVWGTDSQQLSVDVPFRPYVAVSDDGGRTWGEPIDIFRNAGVEGEFYGGLSHELVVAPDGTVYSFGREFLAPDAEGDVRLLMYSSSDGGDTWAVTPFLEGFSDFRAPYSAVDSNTGRLYVVLGATDPQGEGDDPPAQIFFTSSADGGRTWSEPARISDAEQPGDTFEPEIDVAPNGRIDVAWHDFRNDPFGPEQRVDGVFTGERFWDVYATYSTDGGATWAPNLRITPTSIDAAEGATFNNKGVRGPIGLASTDAMAYLAWADTRASWQDGDAEDAYFSRIRFGAGTASTPGAAAGSTGTRWLWGATGAAVALVVVGLLLLLGVRTARRRPPSGRAAGVTG